MLPNATETRIVVTGNYRAWRHFIAMRATEHADVEIRELAVECLRQLQREVPERVRRLRDRARWTTAPRSRRARSSPRAELRVAVGAMSLATRASARRPSHRVRAGRARRAHAVRGLAHPRPARAPARARAPAVGGARASWCRRWPRSPSGRCAATPTRRGRELVGLLRSGPPLVVAVPHRRRRRAGQRRGVLRAPRGRAPRVSPAGSHGRPTPTATARSGRASAAWAGVLYRRSPVGVALRRPAGAQQVVHDRAAAW